MNIKLIMLSANLFVCSFIAMAQDSSKDILTELKAIKNENILNAKLIDLGKGTEQDMTYVLRYYNIERNRAKSDSVQNLIVRRFPKGELAYEVFLTKFLEATSFNEKKIRYAEGISRFPKLNLDRLHTSMAESYLAKGDIDNTLFIGRKIQDAGLIAGIAGRMPESASDAAQELLNAKIKWHQNSGNDDDLSSLFHQLSIILGCRGNYEEALNYAEKGYLQAKWKSEEMTSNYIGLLSRFARHTEIVNILEPIVKAGKAGSGTRTQLESAYRTAYPGNDVAAYMAQIKKMQLAELKVELEKKLIDKTAPSFIGEDAQGKKLYLSQFKGKTIVIDFWATWCAPCKASFPAMQKAVNQYSADTNVVFIFLHTAQKVADPLKDAAGYLKEKGFNFKLVMDYKDLSTNKSPVAVSFDVGSLPTKLVVDGKGKVRFSVSGYFGNDEALIDELATMIEIAKTT